MYYPGKILLFGEYGIILNSMALAIPYPRFSGQFRYSNLVANNLLKAETASNRELEKLLIFFKSKIAKFHFINLKLFEDEINQGLYFDSSIPVGSGLGSSGALTAAIYERYLNYSQNKEYQIIIRDLASIENYFHGKSSGFDPLISLLKKPIFKGEKGDITQADLSGFFKKYTLYLINTHSEGNTGIFVNHFIEKYQNPGFKKIIDNEYIPIINQTIKAMMESDFESFDKLISKCSEIQLSHFGEMIPEIMKNYFKYGIDSDDFCLKLCGSGGGGFILGISRNLIKAESYFNLNHLDWTIVNLSEL